MNDHLSQAVLKILAEFIKTRGRKIVYPDYNEVYKLEHEETFFELDDFTTGQCNIWIDGQFAGTIA